MTNLERCLREKVKLEYYREGVFFYKCESGLRFSVTVEEVGNETLETEEQGIRFSRWINKALNIN